MHLSSETMFDCVQCEQSGTLSKMLGRPIIHKTQKAKESQADGSLTKKFIEENREILKQQQKEAVKKTYE